MCEHVCYECFPYYRTFSAQFKKKFCDALLTGMQPRVTVTELEINPDMLGETRIAGLITMIRNEVKSGGGVP